MTPQELAEVGVTPNGEALEIHERLVVAPCQGTFKKNGIRSALAAGEYVVKGQTVASLIEPNGNTLAICSPFSGWVMGYMVPDGSPIRPSEPVLWLRSL